MQNVALMVETVVPSQEVDIVSTGVESLAVAALLSSRGRDVRFTNHEMHIPEQLLIKGEGVNYKAGRLQSPKSAEDEFVYRSSDLMLVCGKASDYRHALNTVAEMLNPGQTVFIVDAPLGTAFELSNLVHKLRKRMAVNIIEMGALFDRCKFEGRALEISGLKEQVAICGRSINETRSGLAVGRQLFTGLVPASNVLERGLSDIDSLAAVLVQLFRVEAAQKGHTLNSLSLEQTSMLHAFEAELQALGKLYNVSVPARTDLPFVFGDFVDHEKQDLAARICDTFILLTDLAQVAYFAVPTIEKVIDGASKVLAKDLKAEGRRLCDLGLVGMDLREIIELINS